MLSKILVVIGVIAAVALGYVLNTTSPVEAGATGVLAVFLLSYIVSVVVLTFFVFWTYKLMLHVFYSDRTGHAGQQLSLRKAYYYASILALGPVILVSLRSVGQAGAVQLFLVLALLALGCLYVSRQTS
ncbi:hypothetical protein GII36_01150 [Candidatus Mycosynbacter amalyticus]|uniref:Uncharacterized protein n=1 Tax=Candidatus Mycosynbacter amalyticus TaxID=2665156 RepID=A0A857MJZ3_9BACT|nr:hypothetical protein [Candidatus Mycosynbacter amalyticus]QHN42458.1 hypothetical protein GII36_01150 [Candidatus Mycosynbacter amalyticus]